jgi:hypothetical protein
MQSSDSVKLTPAKAIEMERTTITKVV